MHPLPECISKYWYEWLTDHSTSGYILTDHQCRVVSWGGDLQQLGIGPLESDRPITDQLLFTEGLLPISEPSLFLPMVSTDLGHPLDLHVLQHDNGYGLLLLDACSRERRWSEARPMANDSTPCCTEDSLPENPTETLENFFKACNAAALILDCDDRLKLMGSPPEWLQNIFPDLASGSAQLQPENYFSFLENFVFDARNFWARNEVGIIRSGIWIETDSTNREHLFEATAINTGLSKILLITNEKGPIGEKHDLIQRGRDEALGHSILKRSQGKLKLAHDALEARVQNRTQEIEQAKQRLEVELSQRRELERERTEMLLQLQQSQKMEAIGTLAGGIAHDFNNILSAVVGFTELTLFDAPKDSTMASNLQQVLSAALRAKELVRQILTFSRQSRPETRPVQFKGIIKEAMKLMRATLPATVEIVQDIQSDGHVMADPTQLHQVVMNLCTNAGQAMVDEGGTLEVRLHSRMIGQSPESDYQDIVPGHYVELGVKDNGAGMTDATLGRIFDPFFTTKEKGQGTGMGLAVVHGIVKGCKGAISVKSQVGKGTDFRIILPIVDRIAPSQIVDPSTLPRGNERVLFVDDEPMQAELAMQILPPLGYQVTAFTDSSKALKAFADRPADFDIVLTDMYMPKITGKSLAMEILRLRPEIPIILCSGYSVDLVHPEFLDQYFKGHLMKPILIREMAETIRRAIDQNQ